MYRGRLERDLSVWVEKGLLPEATARGLLSEYDARPASFSLGRVLMILYGNPTLGRRSCWSLLRTGKPFHALCASPSFLSSGAYDICAAVMLSRGEWRLRAAPGDRVPCLLAEQFRWSAACINLSRRADGDVSRFAMAVISAVLFRSGVVARGGGLSVPGQLRRLSRYI